MTPRDPRDDFERRLHNDLHAWTDGVDRSRSWAEEAQSVLAASSERRVRPARRWPLAAAAAGTVGVAVVAVGLAVSFGIPRDPGSSPLASAGSPPPSASASRTAAPTSEPGPDALPPLGEIAWWDTLHISFGYTEPPSPTDPVAPEGFVQVRIGTLDGRVTAMLSLSFEWGHWYVGGPLGGEILVADDLGGASAVSAVTAATGQVERLFVTADLVTAVAPAPGGDGFYYAKANRASGEVIGVWYRDRTSEDEVRLLDEAPGGFGSGDVDISRLEISPDGSTLVVQYCFGALRCSTYFIGVDQGSRGDATETDEIGWVEGFVGREAYGPRLTGERVRIAVDMDTLESRVLTEIPSGVVEPDRYRAELPPGWFAHWPTINGESVRADDPVRGVRLENLDTGERHETPPLTLTWPSSCEPITPREMPSGLPPGTVVSTLENGMRHARIGRGDDLVREAMGEFSIDLDPVAAPVSVRGHSAYLVVYGSPGNLPSEDGTIPGPGLAVPTLVWWEGDCTYLVALPALTQAEALDYASRF